MSLARVKGSYMSRMFLIAEVVFQIVCGAVFTSQGDSVGSSPGAMLAVLGCLPIAYRLADGLFACMTNPPPDSQVK